jgi:hypothetical protein
MRVNPCGWGVDVARRTGKYAVFPLRDDENAVTWIRTFFTEMPFLPFPHWFTSSDWFVDRFVQEYPGWSTDWQYHRLRRGPPFNLLPPSVWVGTLQQWLGETYTNQPPVPIDRNGMCAPCQWAVILDERNGLLPAFVLQEDGSLILMESQQLPIT